MGWEAEFKSFWKEEFKQVRRNEIRELIECLTPSSAHTLAIFVYRDYLIMEGLQGAIYQASESVKPSVSAITRYLSLRNHVGVLPSPNEATSASLKDRLADLLEDISSFTGLVVEGFISNVTGFIDLRDRVLNE